MLKIVLLICASVGVLSVGLSNCAEIPVKAPLKWTSSVLQSKVTVGSLKSTVQGFDFSADEMQKLKLWERGIVSYYIDVISFDKVLRDRIRNFLDATSGLSGLQFLELPQPPEDPDTRWVFFVNRRGQLDCSDHSIENFTTKGVQKVVLGYDCMTNKGELAEVVLALAGIPAQHNAPNRDRYVNINLKHIIPEKRYLFKKVSAGEWLFHKLDYDFASAGHYNFLQHSLDGVATIKPKKPVDVFVGEGDGFSYLDILKLRMLYNFIRKPKVDGLGSTCKKLFKPGPNLAKSYPREDLVQESIEPRKKPKEYLSANGLPIEESDSKKNNSDDEGKNRNDEGNNSGDDNAQNNKNDADDNVNVSNDKVENEKNGADDDVSTNDRGKKENDANDDKDENNNAADDPVGKNDEGENVDENVDKNVRAASSEKNISESSRHKLKVTKKGNDPLSVLSDYNTDEFNRINRAKLKLVNKIYT